VERGWPLEMPFSRFFLQKSNPNWVLSPLYSVEGFDPVFGRGLDVFHQILGPPKELFTKIWESTLRGDSLE